jgi:hypothetical protein
MNLQEIEKLLEKYFEGETSLSEEQRLRDYFSSGNVPERWRNLQVYFNQMKLEKEIHLDSSVTDSKMISSQKEEKVAPLIDLRRPWIYWMTGIAASILILIAVFVKFDPFSKRIEDTYKDPQTAYVEARKILLYVSSQMNKGTRNLKPVATLQTGLDELKPVAEFDKAATQVQRLSEIEKVDKLITNN